MVHSIRAHGGMKTQEKSELEAAAGSCPAILSDPVEPVYYAVPGELGRIFGSMPMCWHGRSGSADIKPVVDNASNGVGPPNIR